jgi:uncharacterized protein YlxP (DUF503 family)
MPAMSVGVCRITLRLPENGSLKGKRQVVKSVIERLRNKFNVSASEVDDNDRWQIATIGVTCVSNTARHAEQQLQEVVRFVERQRLDAELLDTEIDVTSF